MIVSMTAERSACRVSAYRSSLAETCSGRSSRRVGQLQHSAFTCCSGIPRTTIRQQQAGGHRDTGTQCHCAAQASRGSWCHRESGPVRHPLKVYCMSAATHAWPSPTPKETLPNNRLATQARCAGQPAARACATCTYAPEVYSCSLLAMLSSSMEATPGALAMMLPTVAASQSSSRCRPSNRSARVWVLEDRMQGFWVMMYRRRLPASPRSSCLQGHQEQQGQQQQ